MVGRAGEARAVEHHPLFERLDLQKLAQTARAALGRTGQMAKGGTRSAATVVGHVVLPCQPPAGVGHPTGNFANGCELDGVFPDGRIGNLGILLVERRFAAIASKFNAADSPPGGVRQAESRAVSKYLRIGRIIPTLLRVDSFHSAEVDSPALTFCLVANLVPSPIAIGMRRPAESQVAESQLFSSRIATPSVGEQRGCDRRLKLYPSTAAIAAATGS